MKHLITITFFFVASFSFAQNGSRYRVSFADKENSVFSVDEPEMFLSARAIERREKFSIPVTEQDFPVNQWYIDSVVTYNAVFCNSSKWFNSIVVAIDSANEKKTLEKIHKLPFVRECVRVAKLTKAHPQKLALADTIPVSSFSLDDVVTMNPEDFYGISYDQIAIVNGANMHKDGYMGKGMLVAVLDAGFLHVDSAQVLQHLWRNNQIVDYKDFSGQNIPIFEEANHGAAVLSLIGGFLPGTLVGTAPQASFLLLRTEEGHTEYPVEEENWIAAIEYADSAGADVANTSLGYSTFDEDTMDYVYTDMNGKTARISQASQIAAAKGMLLVTSAGNSGLTEWQYITAPADADSIITVGAINQDSSLCYFSSQGPSPDKRIKPEVVTLGMRPAVMCPPGNVKKSSAGTSFSAPLMTGMVTCLWQEFPDLSAQKIREAVIFSAHKKHIPDGYFGYGIPDFEKARKYLRLELFETVLQYARVYPNPFTKELKVEVLYAEYDTLDIHIFSSVGRVVFSEKVPLTGYVNEYSITELSHLNPGVYVVVISCGSVHYVQKITKQ
ncbi:MAG: S8 family serine peptidase [Bacteroidales bacterium]|jgi:serine protease AprX|nr:S8 family serine peptidase [Bacteroidales bacterium]